MSFQDSIFDNVNMEEFNDEQQNDEQQDNQFVEPIVQTQSVEQKVVKQVRKPSRPPRPGQTSQTQRVKQPRPTKAKTIPVQQNVDFKQMFNNIQSPAVADFVKHPIVSTIMWLLKNCKREKLGTIMENKTERRQIKDITPDVFKTMIKQLYTDFCFIYRVKQFVNIVKTTYPEYKLNKDGWRVRLGNRFSCDIDDEQHFKQVSSSYKSTIGEIFRNIDLSSITLDKILEFIRLPINQTSNAYKLSTSEFDKFGYQFDNKDDITFDDFGIDENIKTTMYHELFLKTNISKPANVFTRRAAFVEHLDEETISENINESIEELSKVDSSTLDDNPKSKIDKHDVDTVVAIMSFMLNSETFKNILFKGFTPNVILGDMLNKLFKCKAFELVLNNCLWSISYLFTPWCFWNDGLAKFIQPKQTQTLINRRKLMLSYLMTNDDVSQLKNNSWWLNIVVNPECLHDKQNIWFTTNEDIVKEQKRLLQQQTKKNKQLQKQTIIAQTVATDETPLGEFQLDDNEQQEQNSDNFEDFEEVGQAVEI